MKRFFNFFSIFLYTFAIAEIGLRIISNFINISDIEKFKYKKELIRSSNNPNLLSEHIPNSQSKLMGVNIVLNSLGHRNKELTVQKPKNEYRIYVIGGSLIMGWGVEQENLFSSILEKKLNLNENIKKKNKSIIVINSGIMNTNTQNHFQLIKDQFSLTKPDTVILGYFINDAEIIRKKKNNLILKHSYFLSFIYLRIKSYFFSGTIADYYIELYNENNLGWLSVKKSIENLRDFCEGNNVNFVILFLPDFNDFSEGNKLNNLYFQINSRFSEMNISVINTYDSLSKEFKSNPNRSWISRDDSHPNSRAHEIIANDLYNFFIKQKNNLI